MNGDLSLSQSLGGLRIANPDEDEDDSTFSAPSPPIHPSNSHEDQHQQHPAISIVSTATSTQAFLPPSLPAPSSRAPNNPSFSSYDARYDTGLTTNGYSTDNEDWDASTSGADPAGYMTQPQSYSSQASSPLYASLPPEETQHSLGHKQSIPLAQEAQQQPYYSHPAAGRIYNQPPTSHRPLSGFYHHANMSSSSNHITESSYQRVRAESTQSANSNVPRSNSRSGPGSAFARSDHRGGQLYRQASNPVQSASGYPPTRRSSRISPHEHQQAGEITSRYGAVAAASPASVPTRTHGSVYENGVPPGASGSNSNLNTSQERIAAMNQPAQQPPSQQQQPQQQPPPTEQTTPRPQRPVKRGVKDFQFGRTLGEGSYSTVLAATDRQTHREFAIKVLDKKHIIKEKKVKYVNIERDTLNRLTDHPGIVRLYFTFQDERSLYFVLDLATGGELLGVLKKTTSFDEECTRFYAAQTLDAIEYMHSRGVIHRDLKPENVLLDDQMHVKITDFGTAKILDVNPATSEFGRVSVNNTNNPLDGADQDRAVSFVGTAEYVSPELLTDKNACKASDLWAFGCIVYQLLAGRPPFKASNEYQTFQKIVHLDYSFPDGFPSVARDLVTKLLVLDPGQRLPIDGIKAHPFFEGITWGRGLWKQRAPKLRPFVPYNGASSGYEMGAISTTASADNSRDSGAQSSVSRHTSSRHGPTSSTGVGMSSSGQSSRPQPRVITALAPPSQLDIEWSPVLNKNNERILQLEQLVVYSSPAPTSPTSRGGGDGPAETPGKLSRLFGASSTKKRKRLVMVTSSGRLILAPSEGDKKEAKLTIDLLDPEVSWKSQLDQKGYTVWAVNTRDKHMLFEDPRSNTGDSGSSVRSAQNWLTKLEVAKEGASNQPSSANPYTEDSYSDLNSRLAMSSNASETFSPAGESNTHYPPQSPPSHHQMRKTLRKDPATEEEAMKSRKRFSRRHSKNGLTAVF